MPQRKLEELTPDECFSLLADQVVGRLVYVDELGPVAVPVNFALDGKDVVFRIEGGSKLDAVPGPLAFEVDHIDSAKREGWSVLLRGQARVLPIESVPELLQRATGHFPQPWAAGHHNTWVVLTPRTVTGRRLAVPFYAPLV